MSSDSGVFIAQFPDGFRVTKVVGCIDNIDFFPEGTPERKKELRAYFGNSKVYLTLEEATQKARQTIKEFRDTTEYGVCFLPGLYETFD